MPKSRRAARYFVRTSETDRHNVPASRFNQYLAAGLIVLAVENGFRDRVGILAPGIRARVVENQLVITPPAGVPIVSNWRAVERAFLIANAGQHQMPIGFSERLIRQKHVDNPTQAQSEINFLRQHQREWDIEIFHCDRRS